MILIMFGRHPVRIPVGILATLTDSSWLSSVLPDKCRRSALNYSKPASYHIFSNSLIHCRLSSNHSTLHSPSCCCWGWLFNDDVSIKTVRRRMIWLTDVEQLVEWKLEGETEVFGDNLSQCHLVHHKSHMTWTGIEPGTAALGISWAAAWSRSYWQGLRLNVIKSHVLINKSFRKWMPLVPV
jgi:hypothetical protein